MNKHPLAGVSTVPCGAPATPDDGYGKRGRCNECGHGFYGCICDIPEPEPEYFRPGINRDPDSGWARAERSAYNMPGVGK